MKILAKLTLILIAIFGLTLSSYSQQTITPEKKKLIAEMIVLTKADQQIVEITDKMLESMETIYPTIVEQLLARNTELPTAEKNRLGVSMSGSFKSFSQKFRERLPVEIDYPQYVEDSIYPLYDKFFTEKELADLVAFYKTETGQKIITVMPKLFAESMKLSQQLLLPKVIEIADQIIKEELDKLLQGSTPPPPIKNN